IFFGAGSAAGRDADDTVERGLGDVQRALAVENDAARITEVAGDDAHRSGRRDPEDLTDMKPATDEHAAVGPHRQVVPVVMARGPSPIETKRSVRPRPP